MARQAALQEKLERVPDPQAIQTAAAQDGASAEKSAQVRQILTIKLRYVLGALWLCAAVVVLLSVLQDLLIFLVPEAGFSDRIYRLDLDTESSLPTWFATSLMMFCALSLLLVAVQVNREKRRQAIPWFLLAIIFCALSLDEVAMIHEWLSAALSARIDNSGLFYFAWTLPALVICIAGLLCFVPFIFSFRGFDRGLLIGSAVVFLSGAIGMEMLGGAQAEVVGFETLRYRAFATIEESLEYAGVLLFLLFIFRQLRASHNKTTICFE